MHISLKQFETIINKKLRVNQFLFYLSVVMAITVFLINQSNMYWALYFLVMGALALPSIQKCKKDLRDFKEFKLLIAEGSAVDIFPEKDGNLDGNWIIFLQSDKFKGIQEFMTEIKPEVKVGTNLKIYYTSCLTIPVKIEEICDELLEDNQENDSIEIHKNDELQGQTIL